MIAGPRRSVLVLALLAGLLTSCSGRVYDVVFESVDHEVVECPAGTPEDSACLTVTAPVVGEGTGSGNCVLYAASIEENLVKVADSGELELRGGDTITWKVVVQRPDDPSFHEWNPVCTPMIEG
jgi:hypothetical protein